ncbi:MAG TPA: hypothetical protein VK097_13995 [Lentibacillus sp.]|uniref:hypothetical protein n=1 Tax=Lentibacillus sp. TaxID=1925746 RepID=UPI002B4B78B7|nr:hypothetical protein [Lentibacillus sp.]HLR63523.1 hypothetical protein [Lentibacillus sp.]
MYSSDELTGIAENCKNFMNEITKDKPERDLAVLEEIVVKTSLFEYMFWDMAEKKEEWPINLQES